MLGHVLLITSSKELSNDSSFVAPSEYSAISKLWFATEKVPWPKYWVRRRGHHQCLAGPVTKEPVFYRWANPCGLWGV